MWTRISSELLFISSVNISQRKLSSKQKWKDYSHNVNCHKNLEDHFSLSRISLELCWEALSTAVVAQITSLTFLQKLKTILTFQNITYGFICFIDVVCMSLSQEYYWTWSQNVMMIAVHISENWSSLVPILNILVTQHCNYALI